MYYEDYPEELSFKTLNSLMCFGTIREYMDNTSEKMATAESLDFFSSLKLLDQLAKTNKN